jgi:ribonuclease P protein component
VPPQAAFVVGRTAGGAVTRNRVRRRLRAALRELQAAGRLPAGSYLLGGSADLADLPWSELVEQLGSAIDEATT